MNTSVTAITITLGLAAFVEAAPGIANETLTDLTPRGFSVVWTSTEPATASLEVFGDAAGTVPVATALITSHPTENNSGSVREAAEDLGVMKANVSNLAADLHADNGKDTGNQADNQRREPDCDIQHTE